MCMHRWIKLDHTVVLQPTQQSCLPSVIESEEDDAAALLVKSQEAEYSLEEVPNVIHYAFSSYFLKVL